MWKCEIVLLFGGADGTLHDLRVAMMALYDGRELMGVRGMVRIKSPEVWADYCAGFLNVYSPKDTSDSRGLTTSVYRPLRVSASSKLTLEPLGTHGTDRHASIALRYVPKQSSMLFNTRFATCNSVLGVGLLPARSSCS